MWRQTFRDMVVWLWLNNWVAGDCKNKKIMLDYNESQ